MKKLTIGLIVVLAITVTMKITGAVLAGVQPRSGSNFDMSYLANTLMDLGMIGAALSGIALIAVVVAAAVRGEVK